MPQTILEVLRDSGKITSAQFNAAADPAKEVLCLACAGSGKSRTLAYRIARLIHEGNEPSSIVAFTFTEKAAESIKRRVAEALREAGLPITLIGAMYIGTIHSYCQFLLGEMDARYRQFDVLDENRLKLYLLSRYYQAELNLKQFQTTLPLLGPFRIIPEISDAWKTANDELIDLNAVVRVKPDVGTVLVNLKDLLEKEQYIDFSLMIRLVVEALKKDEANINQAVSALKHLMVDEYQDVNPAQEELIRELHKRSETLFVVGDDDQAIYGWRGANVNNILEFGQRYTLASSHTLSENFRSTQAIVETSNNFIIGVLSSNRLDKNPYANNCDPDKPRDFKSLWFNERQDEADWVAERIAALLGTKYVESDGTVRGLTKGDFAILMRSTRTGNSNPRHFEFTNALRSKDIEFTIESAGGIFDRPHAIILRDTFELLRTANPLRSMVEDHFNTKVLPVFQNANFNALASIIAKWNLEIHTPPGGARRKVYPQQLLHEILNAFGIASSDFSDTILRDLGVFSNIILDIEKVFISIDSAFRYTQILNFLSNVAETGYDVSTTDLITKPDAVMVSTVHKMKGLEYPVVFLVDIVAQRFPVKRSSYKGWLPASLIQNAISRGAYGTSVYDEARLFYTALTRAERFLYVTGSAIQPDNTTAKKPSEFSRRLTHSELSVDPDTLPLNLERVPEKRRFDETEVPTSYSQIKDFLTCPKKYKFRQHFGFSPPVPEMFGFGLTTHTAIGRLHQLYPTSAPTGQQAEDLANSVFYLKHSFQSSDPVNRPGGYENAKKRAAEVVKNYVENFSDDFTQGRQVEARFEVKAEKSLITGAIDLLLKEDNQGNILDAKVIDFKSLGHPGSDEDVLWTDLALQVQLYAHAAKQILGENAQTGLIHFLKQNQRVEVPVGDQAKEAAIKNIEWAVGRILDNDFPKRPSTTKCDKCDFKLLCDKVLEPFKITEEPPAIHTPNNQQTKVSALSDLN